MVDGEAGRNLLSGGRGNDLIVASAGDKVRGGAGVNEVRAG
jgi:Ca2+-binding RTX toxin-like protein